MLGNSDTYPVSRRGRPPYPVIAGLDPGRDPAIRSGTSLRQMADWVAGSDEWVAINLMRSGVTHVYAFVYRPAERPAIRPNTEPDISPAPPR